MIVIEPLRKILIEDKAVDCEEVREDLFGGFCSCGGKLKQRFWAKNGDRSVMIAECEKCWTHEAIIFEGRSFKERLRPKIVTKRGLIDFLKDVLSEAEFEAVKNRLVGKNFNPTSFSRAKKRLERMNVSLDRILEILK